MNNGRPYSLAASTDDFIAPFSPPPEQTITIADVDARCGEKCATLRRAIDERVQEAADALFEEALLASAPRPTPSVAPVTDAEVTAYLAAHAGDFRRIAGRSVRPELKLNLLNVTDTHFRSGIASPTPNAHDAIARDGSIVAGSAPTYYIGGGFAAMLTASAGF